MKSNTTSVREIMDMARDAYNNTLNETTRLMKAAYGINPAYLKDAIKFSLEDLEGYDEEAIQKIYDLYYTGEEEHKETDITKMRATLIDCKRLSNTAFQTKEEYDKIQEIYDESVDTEWKRRNSKEYREATLKRLDTWREELKQLDSVKDSKSIRDLRGKIEFLESTITLDFIVDRIQHVDTEKASIIRQFFSEREGGYAKNRCIQRSPKFGFDANWYKYFFNLEENFLPEEYHVFNNLFLFNVMRFVGYQDPYSVKERGMVQSIINSLTGLVYHKFEDHSMEEMIIKLIEQYDSYFMEYREKFESENTTHPNHPIRLEYSKKIEADKRNEILASLQKFDLPVPENAADMSVRELHKYFNHAMEEMVAKNTKEKELHGDAEVSEEEGVTKIAPTFLKDKYRNPIDVIDGHNYFFEYKYSQTPYAISYQKLHERLIESGTSKKHAMFELYNPDVHTVDLYGAANLSQEEQEVALEEMKQNFWYFWKYALGMSINMGEFLMIDAEISKRTSTDEGIVEYPNTWECFSRYAGKTVTSAALLLWKFLFYPEQYLSFVIIAPTMHEDAAYNDVIRSLFNKLPSWLRDKKSIWDEEVKKATKIHYWYSIDQLREYIHNLRTKYEDNIPKFYLQICDMEFVDGINQFFAKEEHVSILSYAELHMHSVPKNPDEVPFLNERLDRYSDNLHGYKEQDGHEIYRLYDVDDSNGRTFNYLLVNDKPIISSELINYIEVAPDNLWLIKPNGTIFDDFTGITRYREIYLKRVTEDMIVLYKKEGMTDQQICSPSFKPSYITYREAMDDTTFDEIMAKMEQAEKVKRDSEAMKKLFKYDKPVELLKEKMDTEGTMSVEDYLAGDIKS